VLFSEPKIPQFIRRLHIDRIAVAFQCSSASRKFLNQPSRSTSPSPARSVSVLFSEPKIPQSSGCFRRFSSRTRVSVLFSEPKIPQFPVGRDGRFN